MSENCKRFSPPGIVPKYCNQVENIVVNYHSNYTARLYRFPLTCVYIVRVWN